MNVIMTPGASFNLWSKGEYVNGETGQRDQSELDTTKTYTLAIFASPDFSTESTGWFASPRNPDGSSKGNLFYMNNLIPGGMIRATFTGAASMRINANSHTGNISIMIIEGDVTPGRYEPYLPYKFYGDIKLPSRYQPATASDTTKFPTVLTGWTSKVLDGVSNGLKFNSISPLSTFYYSNVPQAGITPSIAIFCSHFENRNAVQNNVCYAGINAITFHHSYSSVEDANGWLVSEYAAGHPVKVLLPLSESDGSVWNFVKDTKDNVFGYLNKATGEFCKAYGATGTLSTTVYDHYMLKGGAN